MRENSAGIGLSLLLLLLFIGTSCEKNEDFSDFDLLVDKEWRLVSVTEEGAVVTRACDTDDVLKFDNAEDFSYDFGEVCEEDGTLTFSASTWKMRDNFRVIRLRFTFRDDGVTGDSIDYWEIVELTENTLILKDDTAEDNDMPAAIRRYEF